MAQPDQIRSIDRWHTAWQYPAFRRLFLIGLALLFITLATFPFFFQTIEKRSGIQLHDWLLNQLPPHNMSIPIFIIIWAATALMFTRAFQNPDIFILLLWAYVILSISRLLVISIVPLDPPRGLVELKDPIANTFYGMKPVTKDLFYSGHTSTLFLMFLCLKKKTEKILILLATLVVVILLLIQHIHYTIDVLAAPVFTYIIFIIVKKNLPRGCR